MMIKHPSEADKLPDIDYLTYNFTETQLFYLLNMIESNILIRILNRR
jgi:hypothetical protein